MAITKDKQLKSVRINYDTNSMDVVWSVTIDDSEDDMLPITHTVSEVVNRYNYDLIEAEYVQSVNDISGYSDEIQTICNAVWVEDTPEAE